MIALCLSSGALSATLYLQTFTLAWMHSVEKVRWEEDWRIDEKGLFLTSARIVGMGAGMEPPSDAFFKNGAWHYTPTLSALPELILTHSSYTPGYELCIEKKCQPLINYFSSPLLDTTITLKPCKR